MEYEWVLASVAPNPFRVFNLYETEEAAQLDMERANHGEKVCCYEPMLYATYSQKERESFLSQPLKEITEEQYDEMLNILPPLQWKRGIFESFFMCEFWTGTFTDMFVSYGGKFYKKLVDYTDSKTWVTPELCTAFEQEKEKYGQLCKSQSRECRVT